MNPVLDIDAFAAYVPLRVCLHCQWGFPDDEMTPYVSETQPHAFQFLCPDCEEANTERV
jgi:hypothetical protein